MSKRFPFTKRTIEALESLDLDSNSREAEYSVAGCIGLHQKESFYSCRFFFTSSSL
jgi:hypothetical protein